MSNIQIKKYNGSSYELEKPYGYYSDNSDTVDGKHASDFIGNNSLLNINNLNRYTNTLYTIQYKATQYTVTNFTLGAASSNYFVAINQQSLILPSPPIRQEVFTSNTNYNIFLNFYCEKLMEGYDVVDSSFSVSSSGANLLNGLSNYVNNLQEGQTIQFDMQYIHYHYRFLTPGSYKIIRPSMQSYDWQVQKSDGGTFSYILYDLLSFSKTPYEYNFSSEKVASLNTWINSTQFYNSSTYLLDKIK